MKKKKNHVVVDPDQCKGCRLCVESCPKHCLHIGSKINKLGYQYAQFDSGECIACGTCFYVCPECGAITVIADDDKGGAS